MLWGLNDGEMVIHTATWKKLDGFEDCLAVKADKNDFKIIEALAAHGGTLDREKIYNLFTVDQEIVDNRVDSCRNKKLVVASGNKFRLHLEKPVLKAEPITICIKSLNNQKNEKGSKSLFRFLNRTRGRSLSAKSLHSANANRFFCPSTRSQCKIRMVLFLQRIGMPTTEKNLRCNREMKCLSFSTTIIHNLLIDG